MKKILILLSVVSAFWLTNQDGMAQCTSADIMEPGFNFITSSRGCAPFTIQIQTLYLNSPANTKYYVDWGDGSATQTYTQVNAYPNGPIISHLYANAPIACGYQVTIEVENACNPLGSVVLEPINVIVWTEDIILSDPDEYRVCEGFASTISFSDNSTWNCFPRADARINADPRWIQWKYGHAINANRIPNVKVGGATPGGFPYYDPAFGIKPKYPVTGVTEVSLNVQIPATATIGQDFYITLNNWNTCNAYDENLTNGALNPITPGGDNPPRTTESRIVIVAAPTPDFVARKENNSNPIAWDYCIDDIIYFDNESTGPGGSGLVYTWEFYDGPNIADGLLGTKTNTNPVFSFASGGLKLVRLSVGDANAVGSCSAIVEKVVNITPTSIAQISASNTRFCKTPGSAEVFTVTFNDVSIGSTINTEWSWEFFNENGIKIRTEPSTGFSSAVPVPYSQNYTNPGVYKVVLISRDIITKCDTRDEVNIVVYNNPEPSFVSGSVCDGIASELIDNTSVQKINNSKVAIWEWDFDYDHVTFSPDTIFNGTRPDTLAMKFNYGIYHLALRATNDQNGCSAIFTDTVKVFQNPTATFTKDKLEGCSPLTVSFENTAFATQPVPIKEYIWCIDYGSGYVDTLHTDPNASGFTPTVETTFENWSTTLKQFNVILKSVSTDGCALNSSPDFIKVLPSVKPGFIFVNYEPLAKNCTPIEVSFQVDKFTMSLLPDDYTWTVKKGNDTIRQQTNDGLVGQFKHTFEGTGNGINNYTVNLDANIQNICVGDSTLSINVNPIPNSNFAIDTLELACEFMIIEVNASQKGLIEYDWIITKGNTIYMNDTLDDYFTYKIQRPGPGANNLPVNIELKTANYASCKSSNTAHSIIIPSQPQLNASFSVNPEFQVFPGATVTINNLSTRTNPEYTWDFDDGFTSKDEFPAPHVYSRPGDYTIKLHLEEKSCESIDSVHIFIQPTAPIADFTYDPGKGCAPLTVNFTNLTQYGNPDSYRWYFGAGEGTSTGEHPVHVYYEPGIYSVKLEATNESGVTDVAVKPLIIEVYQVPHADFTIRPETVKLPDDPVYITNLSYEADSYIWDFGDGGNSTDFEPIYTYLDTGRFDISLISKTEKGCADTVIYENIIEVVDGNEISIPNAFSPSLDGPTSGSRYNDGRNDVFYPITEGVIAYQMQIYNRWGELLFDTQDTNKGWDGYYKGRLCSPDIYVYKMDFKFIDGREVMKFGDIALIR